MNRIQQTFEALKARGKKGFVAFLTAGYPSLETTEALIPALAEAGADVIELGIPFSDPLADGPTIQESSFQALEGGATVSGILEMVKRVRRQTDVPIACMTYYNPIFYYGEDRFIRRAAEVGVDGLTIPDLPPEEAGSLIASCRAAEMATVFFLAPTTTPARMRKIVHASTGFIYYVSVTGVTGARSHVARAQLRNLAAARALTDKPICVGFGISTPEQVQQVSACCDGVIVGSAIIQEIKRHQGNKDLVVKTAAFVKRLTRVLERGHGA